MGERVGMKIVENNSKEEKTEQLSRLHYKYYIHIDILSFPHNIFYSAKAQTYKKSMCSIKYKKTKTKRSQN